MSTVEGGGNVVTDGLVMYLDAANTKSYVSGSTTWTDLSRSGNSGTLVNEPTFNSSNGGSIVFDGVDDKVTCGNSLNLNQHSICFWFYPKTSITQEIVYKPVSVASPGPGPYEIYTTSGKIYYRLNNNSTPGTTQGSTLSLNMNKWNYICGTYNNVKMRLYMNTILDIDVNFTPTLTNTNSDLTIGSYSDGRYPLSANISNIQIYNRALSAAEVLQNYNATKGRFGL
jgi:hypothetical protein